MKKITEITTTIDIDIAMAEEGIVGYVQSRLEDEYPDALVSVTVGEASTVVTVVDEDGDMEIQDTGRCTYGAEADSVSDRINRIVFEYQTR